MQKISQVNKTNTLICESTFMDTDTSMHDFKFRFFKDFNELIWRLFEGGLSEM